MICASRPTRSRCSLSHSLTLKRQTPRAKREHVWRVMPTQKKTQRNMQWRKQRNKTKSEAIKHKRKHKNQKKIYRYLLNKTKKHTHTTHLYSKKKKKQEEATTAGFFLCKEVLNQTNKKQLKHLVFRTTPI